MGLFNKYFRKSNSDNLQLDIDTLTSLVSNSYNSFKNIKNDLEKILFDGYIISPEVPIEFQEERIALEDEYNDRFIISSGIITLSIIEYLVIKSSKDQNNIEVLRVLKQKIFTNLLRVRYKIILKNLDPNKEENYDFFDTEKEVDNNDENEAKFSNLISTLSLEVKDLNENKGNIRHVLNYFGDKMGQIFPEIDEEIDNRIAHLIKSRIKKISLDLETFFFNLL